MALSPASAAAVFYFFYFSIVGVISPYFGPYLKSLGFSSWSVAVLLALSPLSRLGPPVLWGLLADRTGQGRQLIQLASVLSLLGFLFALWRQDFWFMFLGLAVMQVFWAAALPLMEAITLHHAGARYGQIRVWGSIGFVVASLCAAAVIEWFGLSVVPWVILAMLLALAAVSTLVPPWVKTSHTADVPLHPISSFFRQRPIIWLFVCFFLMAFAHGPYYSFYSIGLAEHGYSPLQIGGLWNLGVLAEIALFWWVAHLSQRYDSLDLLRCSLLVALLRFACIAIWPEQGWLMAVMQLGHAFTFALHHQAALALIHRYFPAYAQGRAQGLYIMVSFGLGGSLGGLLAGAMWEWQGMLSAFLPAAAAAGVAYLLACYAIKPNVVSVNN